MPRLYKQISEPSPTEIKFTAKVKSIGAFQKNVTINMEQTFQFGADNAIIDGDIIQIENDRGEKVWYKCIVKSEHFVEISEPSPTKINFSAKVTSIGSFKKDVDTNMQKTFEFGIMKPIADGSILQIENDRGEKVWYKFIQKPHMSVMPPIQLPTSYEAKTPMSVMPPMGVFAPVSVMNPKPSSPVPYVPKVYEQSDIQQLLMLYPTQEELTEAYTNGKISSTSLYLQASETYTQSDIQQLKMLYPTKKELIKAYEDGKISSSSYVDAVGTYGLKQSSKRKYKVKQSSKRKYKVKHSK
jgi:hypothetical protein